MSMTLPALFYHYSATFLSFFCHIWLLIYVIFTRSMNENTQIYENQVFQFFYHKFCYNYTYLMTSLVRILILCFQIRCSRVHLEKVNSINFSDPIFSICIYIEIQSRVKRPEKVPTQVLNILSTSFQCTSQHFLL